MKINKRLKNLKNDMKAPNKSKIIAGILTFIILGLIIFVGPAKAFVLELNTDKDSLIKGEKIIFNASIKIESVDKYLPIKTLKLNLHGLSPLTSLNVCEFDIEGKPISGCDGMTIKKISEANSYGYGYGYGYDNSYGYGYGYDFGYGYGYGYGYGQGESELTYEISLDTINYDAGNYESELETIIGNQIFKSKDKPAFTINTISTITTTGTSGGNGRRTKIIDMEYLVTGYCGNGVCNSEETSKTCPLDCPEIALLGEELSGNPLQIENETKNNLGFFSGITGAVIGTLSNGRTIIVILFLVGLMGITVSIIIVKRRRYS
ncbi:MAG: hypothetical protein WC584_02525 [Candidatus Pacearchaeota archaeon]